MSTARAAPRAGVLGGMGPEATLAFLAKFYALSHGRGEQERPPLLVDIDPTVPDRNAAWGGRGVSPAQALAAMGRRLRRAGADFCVMPCVTAHGYARDFEAEAGLPLLALPRVVAEALPGDGAPVGLLATTTTLEMRLFQDAFAPRALAPLLPAPAEQAVLMQAIYAVKRGRTEAAGVERVAAALVRRGARTLVIGCTDLSVLPAPRPAGAAVVDALDLLARRTLAEIEAAHG